MNPSSLKVTGAWYQVGGNLTAAIGTTRGFIGEEKIESDLVIIGSSLQAFGYILQIIASNYTEDEEVENRNICLQNESETLDKMGIELLALGNISNVIGTYFNKNEQLTENDYLIIVGNSLQSIGAFLGVEAALIEMKVIQRIIVLGNSMQSLGAGLQAYQGIINLSKDEVENEDRILDKKDERIIALIGIWIQAIGTVISAIGLTAVEKEKSFENNKDFKMLIERADVKCN
ncbi:AraC family transcriptional regulator [Bacillus toyonensis]|uniref:AraC family transcriptional regulator n=1 Tax=Bacillus toyonensis TaxID=155322 RepID=A0AAP8JX48_9BACI|nr:MULTISPECIES: AraC family transcriptional regulator [Bacillus]OTW85213.1 AraC family transcriptional regulator [Bacillus thuringiensis serovar cameroun]OTX01200.1 AraC family transcriptional regulator [Bacillus thuringiensis serovar seoulensis]QPW48672.1 AraC family transcriptional regulator [Bacillus thuringiensis]AXK18275.1 AraC family transcriptional regulator [Bacillus sp. COPE52]MBC2684095.1 AraC family transcriptional regulator [Bacillus toyonensis]